MPTFIVSKIRRGANIFQTLQSAITSMEPDESISYTILVEPGIYDEKIELIRSNVEIIGENPESCMITHGDYGLALHEDGRKVGTFRSYTFLLDGNHNRIKNLTIINHAGYGRKVGQAVALYCDGDQIVIDHCRLIGHQDTLFTGPLPPSPMEPGGFTGPKEFSPRIVGKQLYKDCYIQGDIDFIFGSASAWFEGCQIHSCLLPSELYPQNNLDQPQIHGYITAASTPEEEEIGYIFHQCNLTGDAPASSVYLGRPWRNYAKVRFINCNLGAHIHPEGFHDWNKKEAWASLLFGEYQNQGLGSISTKRASFVKQLSQEEYQQIMLFRSFFPNL